MANTSLVVLTVAVLSILQLFMHPVEGMNVFDVYRLFQLEKGTSPLGSQRVSVSALAATAARKGSLARFIVLVPFDHVNVDKIDEIIQQRSAAALLVLLPSSQDANISEKDIKAWKQIEEHFAQNQYTVPIYFTWRDSVVSELYDNVAAVSESGGLAAVAESAGWFDDLFGSLSAADQYQFVVNGPEASPVKDISVTNLQGWIPGAGGVNTEGQALPTIAIVSYYDSFAVSPSLARGADVSGSGVVALLELARLFGKLYNNPKTQGRHNMLFILTGAGNMNFAGTKNWLANTDVRLLDTIEFALCLDGIGLGQNLYMHVSKMPKEEGIQRLYDGFTRTAQQMKIPLDFVPKKINISNPDIDWEHEQFSRKKIVAATLSHFPSPPQPLARSHIFDTKVDSSILVRNIQFIAESLAKYIYGFSGKELQVFEGSLAVNKNFVESWLEIVSEKPRVQPYLPKKSVLLASLGESLGTYTSGVTNQTFALESEYNFYDTTQTTLSSYRVKPAMFDVLLAIGLVIYMSLLYSLLRGPAGAIEDLKKLFTSQSKKILKKKQA